MLANKLDKLRLSFLPPAICKRGSRYFVLIEIVASLRSGISSFINCQKMQFSQQSTELGEKRQMPGVTVKDVNQQEFVCALAAFLKKSGKLKVPEWVDLVKLAKHKELAPCDDNWFYTRAASTVRHLYLRGGVGVGSMTKIYGGRQRNGVSPAHFSRGSKNVARKVLQSLEGLKMVEKDPNEGRRLTPQGHRDLDRIAGQGKWQEGKR
ncbi:hypothetical protein GJAV_G00005480 [Gymnothorax javanicus]|nr:hypothetical protein GJAV_G00005480 [Gymnothorax javanicus]